MIRLRHVLVVGLPCFLLVILPTVAGLWKLQHWGDASHSLTTPRSVYFPTRTSLRTLAQTLEQKGIIDSALLFRLFVRCCSDFKKFQAGDYRFAGNTSPVQIATRIIAGDIHIELHLRFTVPEGFTLAKIVARMAEHRLGTQAELQQLARDPDLLTSLKINAASLEGYLYPATYSFYQKLPTARQVFARLVAKWQAMLPADYEPRVAEKGLTLHKAVTMASLIELETAHDDERSKISEVIWKRLKDRTPLGIDAAVIYGIKDYKGDLKRRHLRDASNPWNTRIHRGLPPTPIGSPSLASLLAVLNPTNEGHYFYVLIPDGTKRHHFSRTLREHNRHVRKLMRAARRP